jgi:precorrin-2 dehydrogenase / sirohydrochlorin ferrochelatase
MEEGQGEGLSHPSSITYPLFLNLSGRSVVVVGGGRVGLRKAAAALAAGSLVRVVDPVTPSLLSDPHANSAIVHIAEPYRTDHLDGASLVFAAATPEVNARVVADAKARGIWVNSATDPAAGDFILPSVVRSGALTLATSTAGAGPALARRIREKLEAEFDASFAEWVEVLQLIRPLVLAAVTDPEQRRKLLDSFADWPWLARIRVEGLDAVRKAMLDEIEDASRAP